MSKATARPESIQPPETRPSVDDAARAKDLIGRLGQREASRIAGTSRQTLASIAARLEVQPGSLAIFRQRTRPTPPEVA